RASCDAARASAESGSRTVACSASTGRVARGSAGTTAVAISPSSKRLREFTTITLFGTMRTRASPWAAQARHAFTAQTRGGPLHRADARRSPSPRGRAEVPFTARTRGQASPRRRRLGFERGGAEQHRDLDDVGLVVGTDEH